MDPASRVIRYIQSLKEFLKELPKPNHHMGATLTDAVLQAGINFEFVVRPRIEEVRQYSQARTTSDFLALLRSQGVERVLRFKGRKPRTVLSVANLLAAAGVETEHGLKAWLKKDRNHAKLLQVKGVGPKTLDYLQILVGISTVAFDVHLKRFLAHAGVRVGSYDEGRDLLSNVADRMGIDRARLDYSIWKYMSDTKRRPTTGCSRRQRTARLSPSRCDKNPLFVSGSPGR